MSKIRKKKQTGVFTHSIFKKFKGGTAISGCYGFPVGMYKSQSLHVILARMAQVGKVGSQNREYIKPTLG
jgi:hypothetical protein